MFCKGSLASGDRLATSLIRRVNHVAINATLCIHFFEIDLLNRFESEVFAYELTGYQNNRSAITMRIIYTIDKMQAARATTPRTGDQSASQLRLR